MDGGIDLMSYEPIVALTDTLLKSGYRGETPTITDDAVLGGVLRIRYPGVRVIIWKPGSPLPAEHQRPHLLLGQRDGGLALFERAGRAMGASLRLSYVHAKPGHSSVEYRYVLAD
mgnify:CR=1 FL=1|jgi:hypothetical protein